MEDRKAILCESQGMIAFDDSDPASRTPGSVDFLLLNDFLESVFAQSRPAFSNP
jgi:hypothetical protein